MLDSSRCSGYIIDKPSNSLISLGLHSKDPDVCLCVWVGSVWTSWCSTWNSCSDWPGSLSEHVCFVVLWWRNCYLFSGTKMLISSVFAHVNIRSFLSGCVCPETAWMNSSNLTPGYWSSLNSVLSQEHIADKQLICPLVLGWSQSVKCCT